MSLKYETIEVHRCDFCISTEVAKGCNHCHKDACSNCAKFYELNYRDVIQRAFTNLIINQPVIFSAFICNDCAKNELRTAMIRLGFTNLQDTV